MKKQYIKLNILPITLEIIFILCCLFLNTTYYIYTNFLFYILLVIYFYYKKDFLLKEWLAAMKGKPTFWKQVILTILFFCFAFIITTLLERAFPHMDTGMIMLKADSGLKLLMFIGSTIIFPPIGEEIFYRKNLISFKSKKILIITTLFSMILYALEHALTIWGILLGMIWALPLSISYIKTKNVYVPMTAHFICNIIVNGTTAFETCCFLLN